MDQMICSEFIVKGHTAEGRRGVSTSRPEMTCIRLGFVIYGEAVSESQ